MHTQPFQIIHFSMNFLKMLYRCGQIFKLSSMTNEWKRCANFCAACLKGNCLPWTGGNPTLTVQGIRTVK